MKKIPVLNSMELSRDTRFLKNYTLNFTNTAGNEKIYETVSHFNYESMDEIGTKASGAAIIGFKDDKILLVKEFRMGTNHMIYGLPAGHIDDNESPEECAKRELFEETGLSIVKVYDVLLPAYAAPDMSDMSCWIVFAEVEGEFEDHTEEDEWIQPVFLSKEEVRELLKTERFSARAQLAAYYFMMH